MLNIPESIKTLFKSDSVFKNFRVHFPNGEYSDLTNENIISESVSFTESICSKDVFQFGLSERSQIEFECVNMPNIYGVTIECGIEIDTSSLSASEIADIQSGTYDGALVLEADSDIGFGYYHIPYGVFVVQSCPRSHGAMYRRRVTAYGKAPQDIKLSSFLNQKYSMIFKLPETIQQNPFAIIADTTNSYINWIGAAYRSLTIVSPTNRRSATIELSTGQKLYIVMDYRYVNITNYTPDYFYAMTGDFDLSFRERILADFETRGIDFYTPPNYTGDLPSVTFDKFFFPSVEYNMSDSGWSMECTLFPKRKNGMRYFYPYMPLESTETARIILPGKIVQCLLQSSSSATVYDYGTSESAIPNVSVWGLQLSNTYMKNALIDIKGTGTFTVSSVTMYSYLNSLDLPALYNGVYELLGCFRRIGRDGQDKTVTLSKDTPYAISPEQYSELWWDDFTVDNIGTIILSYKDADAQTNQTIKYEFGSGASVYEMTDNYLLNNLNVSASAIGMAMEDYITGMLGVYFIQRTAAVNFLPYDMTALNIPYFEPGDYVQIDNGDGGTVDTFILSRNISGIQTLYDDSEASSGKLDGEG